MSFIGVDMRYADTYLKNKAKREKHRPFVMLKNRFRYGEDPDLRMERFLRGWGEFSAEAEISFQKQLARNRELKMLGCV